MMSARKMIPKLARPFDEGDCLSSSSIERLSDWLVENVAPDLKLSPDYTVGDLISDLDRIDGGIWSDSIDAMGEDA